MEEKKSKSGIVIGILVVLVLALGGYLVYDKVIKKEEKKVEKTEKVEKKKVEAKETNNKPISFDKTKCINNDKIANWDGKISRKGGSEGHNGVYLEIDESKGGKVVYGYVRYDDIYASESRDEEQVKIEFDKRVEQIFFGQFDSADENATILFLLEDGTVEYIKISDIAKTRKFDHKKIDGVSDIVQLDNIVLLGIPVGETRFAIAYKSDGTYYDLSKFINFN